MIVGLLFNPNLTKFGNNFSQNLRLQTTIKSDMFTCHVNMYNAYDSFNPTNMNHLSELLALYMKSTYSNFQSTLKFEA